MTNTPHVDAGDAWTQASRDIAKLHAEKPRPINKMFGANPTDEQKAKHAELMREWSKKDREARKRLKAVKAAANETRRHEGHVQGPTHNEEPIRTIGMVGYVGADTMPAAKVYVVHTEWEEGGDGGHSIIEGVFATKEVAEAERLATIEHHKREYGRTPYVDVDGTETADGWDFDVHIEEREVARG